MRSFRLVRKDHVSAALLLVIGCGVLACGLTYDVGNLTRMGPGFVPVSLGVMMILVALAIGATAAPAAPAAARPNRHGGPPDDSGPQWRGWLCIIAGVTSFVIVGNYGGLVPATLLAVFISAMGDRDNTCKSAAILAAIVTAFGVAIFHFGLALQLPLFQWGG